ncbi:MAG TPA: hypothetical protein VGU45_04560 [Microvirga sp.]|nr:hypothetical protein [Microvirga sp.]
MTCPYCKLDVDQPCQSMQDVQHRAEAHVDRCEKALERQKDASKGESGGSI